MFQIFNPNSTLAPPPMESFTGNIAGFESSCNSKTIALFKLNSLFDFGKITTTSLFGAHFRCSRDDAIFVQWK